MKRNTQLVRRLSQILLTLLCVGGLVTFPREQHANQSASGNTNEDRVALYQALLDLTNPWTVMCIAAHPDDEDGTSLIVMRHKYGAHTVSLFSTFGEGGQNAIGPELYEELGAIRARETMAAAEIQGSEPHFLGLKDFGYSKSADEAFRVWGHDDALRRMVLQIRKLRPDVIITNHSVTSNDHGHHQATARLELEAFDAAADPKRFPEQLKDDVTTWQVQRLFVRAGRSNQAQADTGQLVTIDPNELDPIRGRVYAEEALQALQKHATQGPWPKSVAQLAARFNSSDGRVPLVRYRLARERKGAEALSKDSHNFLDGLRLPENIARDVTPPMIDGKPLTEFVDQRSRVIDALGIESHNGYAFYNGDEIQRFRRFSASWDLALSLATEVSVKVEVSRKVVTRGSKLAVTTRLSAGPKGASYFGCAASFPPEKEPIDIAKLKSGNISYHSNLVRPGSAAQDTQQLQVPSDAPIDLPLSRHLYDSSSTGLAVDAGCSVIVLKSIINVARTAHVDVAAPIQIENISPSPIVLTPGATSNTPARAGGLGLRDFDFKLRVTNNQDSQFSGRIVLDEGVARGASRTVTVAAHEKAEVTLSVPGDLLARRIRKTRTQPPEPTTLIVTAEGSAQPLARLEVPVVWADARVSPNVSVGYIRGFDYSLPNALAALGVESKELSIDEVKTADLQRFSAVIVDNRVYESKPELIAANQKLLDYAKAGGTLIVFYHKSNEWNPDERRNRPQLAPYKLILGDERITEETAPITFIEPQHPLLNLPNKMGPEDFTNWIQERGLYYPKEWDANYQALLQSNDPGEAPLKGGLLVADYGRGHYIYTSMVWYRELRAGVPGAYRMLANMISYGKTKP